MSFATHFVGDDGELMEFFGLDEINGEFTCCDRVVLKTRILKNSPICAFHHAPISAFFKTIIPLLACHLVLFLAFSQRALLRAYVILLF